MKKNNYLILSIDLDEWYHCRWAVGSLPVARWKSSKECFKDYYKSDKPGGEIIKPTHLILDLLEKQGLKATFFILGEIAQQYPNLVKEIAEKGHEIACHGMYHQSLSLYSPQKFLRELSQARKILKKLSGRPVIGFRAPGLITTEWLSKVLREQGFIYDSSASAFKSKLKGPQNPYKIEDGLWEIPIPTFPLLKLPGAVSIASRVFGWNWTKITLNNALKTGAACYYLHPYELNSPPKLKNMTFQERIFWRRSGNFMEKVLQKILKKYQGRIISAEDYILKYGN